MHYTSILSIPQRFFTSILNRIHRKIEAKGKDTQRTGILYVRWCKWRHLNSNDSLSYLVKCQCSLSPSLSLSSSALASKVKHSDHGPSFMGVWYEYLLQHSCKANSFPVFWQVWTLRGWSIDERRSSWSSGRSVFNNPCTTLRIEIDRWNREESSLLPFLVDPLTSR